MALETTLEKSQYRMSGGDRRQQIVRVAIDLFSRKGFRGTTTKEIAEQAGVSEAIIFRHFATKRDLYSAIIDYKASECAELILKAFEEAAWRKDDRAVFRGMAYSILELHRQDPTLMRLLLYSGLEGHELSTMFFQTHVKRTTKFVTDYIKQRVADRAFRRVDPSVTARAFFSMINHHAMVRAIFSNAILEISSEKAADAFVSVFLEGVLRR
jgi:AcrR family transcriptional regulator